MKIQYSALVGSVSGKLNGSVGSHNKGGAYLRNKGIVSNPQTPAQMAQRMRLGASSSEWRGLTQAERDAWIEAAPFWPFQDRLQQTRYLSGAGLFVKLNTVMSLLGEPQLNLPPVKSSFPVVSFVSLVASTVTTAGVTTVVFTPTINFVNEVAQSGLVASVDWTTSLSPGLNNVNNKYKKSTLFLPAPAATEGNLVLPYGTSYLAEMGNLTIGQKVFARVTLYSTLSGEVGVPISGSTIVVAGA